MKLMKFYLPPIEIIIKRDIKNTNGATVVSVLLIRKCITETTLVWHANPGKKICQPTYRFGYNGKEKDDEVKVSGNSLHFGARIYESSALVRVLKHQKPLPQELSSSIFVENHLFLWIFSFLTRNRLFCAPFK
jgi:hypothetical protein